MSLVEGALRIGADAAALVADGLEIPLGDPAALGLAGPPPERVTLGVRAEDVRVHAEDATEGFPATVALLEPIGSDTFVELTTGSATIVARVSPDLPLRIGEPLRASVAPGRAHLFDTASGARIGA